MKIKGADIVYSGLLGLLLGIVGVHITGYVAAVAVPQELMTIFSSEVTNFIIGLIIQFIGFGILATIAGMILGRLSSRWVLTSLVCYILYMLYLSVGTAFVYDTEIINPYWGSLTYWSLTASYLVVPLCLFLSTYWTCKRSRSSHMLDLEE